MTALVQPNYPGHIFAKMVYTQPWMNRVVIPRFIRPKCQVSKVRVGGWGRGREEGRGNMHDICLMFGAATPTPNEIYHVQNMIHWLLLTRIYYKPLQFWSCYNLWKQWKTAKLIQPPQMLISNCCFLPLSPNIWQCHWQLGSNFWNYLAIIQITFTNGFPEKILSSFKEKSFFPSPFPTNPHSLVVYQHSHSLPILVHGWKFTWLDLSHLVYSFNGRFAAVSNK